MPKKYLELENPKWQRQVERSVADGVVEKLNFDIEVERRNLRESWDEEKDSKFEEYDIYCGQHGTRDLYSYR